MDSGATTYIYDANGNRIQKTTGSNQWHYFYGEGGEVLVEKNQSGTVLKEYIYAAGQRMERSGGQTYFVHTDYLGSTRTVTNYAGSVTDAMDYLPYGEQIAGSSTTTHKFTGQEHDGESGLDYFIARYDSTWMGRFTSPDPLAASAVASNPQTWNRYAYALNNPLRFNDPTGMEGCDATTRAGQENCAAEDLHEDLAKDAPQRAETMVGPWTTTTVNLGGMQVDVSARTITDQYVNADGTIFVQAHGVEITAVGCQACVWTQTLTGTGVNGARADTEPGADPKEYPFAAGREFYDRPRTPDAPFQRTYVTTMGTDDGRTFTPRGSMTWGYAVSSGGIVRFTGVRTSTAAEQRGSLTIWADTTGRRIGR